MPIMDDRDLLEMNNRRAEKPEFQPVMNRDQAFFFSGFAVGGLVVILIFVGAFFF